jgi:rhodanese-related sulfurtransferase
MRTLHKTLALVLVAAVAMLGACATVSAKEEAKPSFKQYPAIVDAAFVKSVVDGKKKGLIVDSRPKRKKYDKGHVPGAISIPFSKFDKMVGMLPKDKNALIIFYCGGLKCPLSHKSAFKSEKLGYKNVKVFATGYPAWKKAYGPGPTAAEAAKKAKPKFKQYKSIVKADFVKQIVDGKKLGLIVDSRPKRKKYDKGHIPGSISLPFSQFDKMKGLLPADKNLAVVFYCGGLHCPLSHKSAFKAEKLGYKNLKVFATGYPAWKKAYGAGPAMAKAAAKPAAKTGSLKPGKEEGSVDLDQFRAIAAGKGPKAYLVDVRDPSEVKTGAIKGSVNIPVDKLEKNLDKLPKDKPIIFVCGTGARSGEAYYMVKDQRPEMNNVYYVDGEITFKKDGSCAVTPPK